MLMNLESLGCKPKVSSLFFGSLIARRLKVQSYALGFRVRASGFGI